MIGKTDQIDHNKAVFTTKPVIERKTAITYVAHDYDDDWQFFGKEKVKDEDVMIVALRQVLEVDSTLLNVMDMTLGMEAIRQSENEGFQKIMKNIN
jgi:hypothetical protein